MISDMSWIHVCGVLALAVVVQGTWNQAGQRCDCNRKSRYCVLDAEGMRCLDCRGNTTGRRCERCEDGFFRWVPAQNCKPCRCSVFGSVASLCDSRGRCSCKEGVTGDKCDLCANGAPLGPNGCTESVLRDEPVDRSTSCFCFGHASSCGAVSGYAVHPINSNFTNGPEGWQISAAPGVISSQVQFRWVQTHEDLEVISQNSLPTYLNAPARYLGNQMLSYGQNLSFSLRLDRGVRHPSTNDVVLEGAGLRVGAALGDLRSILPCGQKLPFSFRLHDGPGSRWRPLLSKLQFQALLHNLTAIKIRTTFGEDGRGYLDNVSLMSARRGPGGLAAPWVQRCLCQAGYQGAHCESCAAGFRRATGEGAFGACEPCDCKAGSCDPDTGDCLSADETPRRNACPGGYYSDPSKSPSCVRCPCPEGVACSLAPGSPLVQCNLCPSGVTGYRCQQCAEGLFGDPLGERGPARPCRPCNCPGRGDAAGTCHAFSGECGKCANDSRDGGQEPCPHGFYRNRLTAACDACNCDLIGSVFSLCSPDGQCTCRDGYQGRMCHLSSCPSCFEPITTKVEGYADKLKALEKLFSTLGGGGGGGPGFTGASQLDATLKAASQLVTDLQDTADQLKGAERGLQKRLNTISGQLDESQDMGSLERATERLRKEKAAYATRSASVQTLIDQMRSTLRDAKAKLRAADLPQGDEAQTLSENLFSSLISKAKELAERHLEKAGEVEQSAGDALKDSEKSLGLMRGLMSRENQVKELLGDLKTTYDQASSRVKAMESQASRLSGQAGAESKKAGDMLKQIVGMEQGVGAPLQVDGLESRMDSLKNDVSPNLSDFFALQKDVDKNKALVQGLLDRATGAQQVYDGLLARANAAKAVTEEALSGINSNAKGMDDTLAALKGFDQRLANGQALADRAIVKLPAINRTIRGAVRSNDQTLGLLEGVSQGYSDALATVGQLEAGVAGLEGRLGSLGPSGRLLTDATALREDLGAMKQRASDLRQALAGELSGARTLQMDSEQAVSDAEDAHDNAMDTRSGVATTLEKVNKLIAAIGQPGSAINEQQVAELEASLSTARHQVDRELKPRLHKMEDLEAAQRRLLGGLDADIDSVLSDIANLEDIIRSVPDGCFNNAPIEHP